MKGCTQNSHSSVSQLQPQEKQIAGRRVIETCPVGGHIVKLETGTISMAV